MEGFIGFKMAKLTMTELESKVANMVKRSISMFGVFDTNIDEIASACVPQYVDELLEVLADNERLGSLHCDIVGCDDVFDVISKAIERQLVIFAEDVLDGLDK